MSWDAHLNDDRGHSEGWWNYTHNTSRMIYDVLDVIGYELPDTDRLKRRFDEETDTYVDISNEYVKQSWYDISDGMTGPEGAKFLSKILTQLNAEPSKYIAMNPSNGWGCYDDICKILKEMIEAVPEWPTVWSASG